MKFRALLAVVLLFSGSVRARADAAGAVAEAFGPEVSFVPSETSTALDLVNAVRGALASVEPPKVYVTFQVNDDEFNRIPVPNLYLKKIPALVALRYLAGFTRDELVQDGRGAWSFRHPPLANRLTVAKIEGRELGLLGLKAAKDGKVSVISGAAWPSAGTVVLDGTRLLVSGKDMEIENLEALLVLIRGGYIVPGINKTPPVAAAGAPLVAKDTWLGPVIPESEVGDATPLDLVKIVRTSLTDPGPERLAVKVVGSDSDLAERPVMMRKFGGSPATVALKELAVGTVGQLKDGGGLLTFNARAGFTCGMYTQGFRVSESELKAVGLREGVDRKVVLSDGSPWIRDEGGSVTFARNENYMLVNAYPEQLEILDALLTLKRSGYKVPLIGSGKPASGRQTAR